MPPLEEVKKEFKGLSSQELSEIENVLKDEVQNDNVSENEGTNEVKESEEQKETLATKEIQEIEKIIDETIDEIQEQEEILQCPLLNVSEETIKEYEEMEQMKPEEIGVSNEKLFVTMLDIKDFLIDMKKDELKIDNQILRKQETAICVSKSIDGKYNKTTAVIMALMFILGILIGIQHEVWNPYITQLLDFAKTTSNIVK